MGDLTDDETRVTFLPWFDCCIVEEKRGEVWVMELWVPWQDVFVPWHSPLLGANIVYPTKET